jgi:cell division protein FtsQ
MRYLWKTLVGVVFILLILGGSFFLLEKNQFFTVQEITITVQNAPENNEYLQPAFKKIQDSLQKYKNQSIWKIDLDLIKSEFARQSWISNHKIDRRFPNSLQILIEPHEVKLLYLSNGSKLIPLIGNGDMLEPIDFKVAPDLPILVGKNFYDDSELRKRSIEVIKKIPDQGSFSKKSISEIRYDNKEGFWMTLIQDGIKVKMGEEQIDIKSERVSQVLDYMETNSFQARVIDANLSKKVLVRLRKDP